MQVERCDSRDVQEQILVAVLVVYGAHQGRSRWQNLIDEDEDGFLGRKLDALPDYVDELTDCKIGRDKILLLVDGCDV